MVRNCVNWLIAVNITKWQGLIKKLVLRPMYLILVQVHAASCKLKHFWKIFPHFFFFRHQMTSKIHDFHHQTLPFPNVFTPYWFDNRQTTSKIEIHLYICITQICTLHEEIKLKVEIKARKRQYSISIFVRSFKYHNSFWWNYWLCDKLSQHFNF